MKLIIHTDGGARGNPGPAASVFIIRDSKGELIVSRGVYIGIATNNQAEYLAVANALIWLKINLSKFSKDIDNIQFYLDSELVVNQLSGKYKIKSVSLSPIIHQIKNCQARIGRGVEYQYIPRSQNKDADHLVNQTLDSLIS